MSSAIMFYGDGVITSLDYATLDEDGRVIGGSLLIGGTVSGDIEENEQVVIDFGTAKKRIKAIIDDKENGFDHKLVIPKEIVDPQGDEQVEFETQLWKVSVPRNALKIIETRQLMNELTAYVNEELKKEFPSVQVHLTASTNVQSLFGFDREGPPSYFSYVHGLKASTSWGCQNIAHGHLSYVQVDGPALNMCRHLESTIALTLNDSIFAHKENVVHNDDNTVTVKYETERGKFEMTTKHCKHVSQNLVIYDKETTIENLVENIFKTYIKVPGYNLLVSEGLSKGAIYNGS